MSLWERHRHDLDRLAALLSLPENQSIVISQCDEPELRKEILAALETKLNKKNISLFPLDLSLNKDAPGKVVRLIQSSIPEPGFKTLVKKQDNVVISIVGSESLKGRDLDSFVYELNTMRDAFAHIPYPVIFWLPNDLVDKVAQHAPDFWSWRSAFFEFQRPTIINIGQIPTATNISAEKELLIQKTPVDIPAIFNNLTSPIHHKTNDSFYVPNPANAINQFHKGIIAGKDNSKILFTGPPGCGKTTELIHLTSTLRKSFFTTYLNAFHVSVLTDLEPIAVLFHAALSLAGQAVRSGIEVTGTVIEEFLLWQYELLIQGGMDINSPEPSSLDNLLLLAQKVTSNTSLGKKITRQLTTRENIFINHFNQVIEYIETATSKKVLLIVDDLDKIPSPPAESMFSSSANLFNSPRCKIVCTIPFDLFDSPGIRERFDDAYYLHDVTTRKKDGSPVEPGLEFLKEVILKRVPEHFIEPDALEQAVLMSGGNLKELLHIIKRACLEVNPTDILSKKAIEKSLESRKTEFRRFLRKEDYHFLKKISMKKKRPDEMDSEHFFQLLFSRAISKYEDGDIWYDVHPLVKPLLPKDS